MSKSKGFKGSGEARVSYLHLSPIVQFFPVGVCGYSLAEGMCYAGVNGTHCDCGGGEIMQLYLCRAFYTGAIFNKGLAGITLLSV